MTQKQKDNTIRYLKCAKLQGGGQSIWIIANRINAWNDEVSKYLQSLKRKGLITYIPTTKVWFWIKEVELDEIIKL